MNLESNHDQFKLITQKRFGPFFGTQFLGACNDNLYKFAVTLLITYQWRVDWLPSSLAGLVIGAVFILPFVVFSAFSGLLADHYNKTRILQGVKVLEIVIMSIAYFGLSQHFPTVLLVCIFLMGLHSTIFGPAKYAYLPVHISKAELMGANALVEAGTFLAILLGNLLGGVLISNQSGIASFMKFSFPEQSVALFCILLSITGLLISLFIPNSKSNSTFSQFKSIDSENNLLKGLNPWTQTLNSLRQSHQIAGMSTALYGISWMWFYGAVFLSLFPSFSKDLLHGNSDVASMLLVVFSIGIGIGSLLCNSLKHPIYELSLVFLGLIGMTIFTIDLAFTVNAKAYADTLFKLQPSSQLLNIASQPLVSITVFLSRSGSFHILMDLGFLSAFIGIFSVPLYTFIQTYSPSDECAQTIAANNILNALFMISSAVIVGVLLSIGLTIAQVFLLLGASNIVCIFFLARGLPGLQNHFFDWVKNFIVNFKNPF